jgi:hypothetical protein
MHIAIQNDGAPGATFGLHRQRANCTVVEYSETFAVVAACGPRNVSPLDKPARITRWRRSEYFYIGKRWRSGNGKTKWSV